MYHLFLVNPAAGGSSKKELIHDIQRLATRHSLDFGVYQTICIGDAEAKARQYAREYPEGLRIYSCGGDGTLNEIVNGVRGFSWVEIAIIPVGSGNDYVRSFTCPGAFLDLEAQFSGTGILVDLIQVNERLAINLVNAGFDAIVGHNMMLFRKLARISRGLVYPLAVASSLLTHPLNSQIEYSVEGASWCKAHFAITVIGCGSCYGGGFIAAPYAEVDDGALEFLMVDSVNYLELAQLISVYRRGQHLSHPTLRQRIEYRRIQSIALRAPKEFLMVLDGEDFVTQEVAIRILPQAQRIVLPQGSKPRRSGVAIPQTEPVARKAADCVSR